MTALEQAKKNIARAEELAQAVKDGKTVETPKGDKTMNASADDFFICLRNGAEYRIIEPKRRRPWTREEAERHVGWVLVGPNMSRFCLRAIYSDGSITNPNGCDPNLEDLCRDNWHVHLPGQPDDLKPCCAEE